jgi:hypothetical protein
MKENVRRLLDDNVTDFSAGSSLYSGEQGRYIQGGCQSIDKHSYGVTQPKNRHSVPMTRFSFSALVLLKMSLSLIILETTLWWQVLQHASTTVKYCY